MTGILLAHEWLEHTGGSENTFEQIRLCYPHARVVSLWNNAPHRFPGVEETWLARTPLRRSKSAALPLMRQAWKRIDLTGVDTVVASSHAMAHHLAGRAAMRGVDALAYVYSPPRYLWAPELDARGQGALVKAVSGAARRLDRRGVHRRVRYVAISHYVAERMNRCWGVEPAVLYPPVDTARLQAVARWSDHLDPVERQVLDALPTDFVLGASRLVEYKRLDVAMTVGEQLGLPVVIAGAGPFEGALRATAAGARVPVHFLGRVSDAALFTLFQRTQLFVFMALEDFGIIPVEAMALGTPTLVRDQGGTREVADVLRTGGIADPDDLTSLKEAAQRTAGQPSRTDLIASTFSNERFRSDFTAVVGAGHLR